MKVLGFVFFIAVAGLWSCAPSEEKLLNKSRGLIEQEQLEEAVRFLDQAVENYPSSATALNMRGSVYYMQGQFEPAAQDFRTAMGLDSTDYKYAYNLGNALNQQNKNYEALQHYNTAIDIKPNVPDLFINRGYILYKLKRYQEANKDFDFAIQINDLVPEAYYNKAKTLLLLDSLDQAKSNFNRAIELKEDYAQAYYWLGLTEIGTNNPEKGCNYLKVANNLGFEQAKQSLAEKCNS